MDPGTGYKFSTTARLDGEKEIDVDEREALMKVSVKMTKPSKRAEGPRWELVQAALVLSPHNFPDTIVMESRSGEALRFPLDVKALLAGKVQDVPVVVRTGVFAGRGERDPGSAQGGTTHHVDACIEAEYKPIGPFTAASKAGQFALTIAED